MELRADVYRVAAETDRVERTQPRMVCRELEHVLFPPSPLNTQSIYQSINLARSRQIVDVQAVWITICI